jgi:hypothetical protein
MHSVVVSAGLSAIVLVAFIVYTLMMRQTGPYSDAYEKKEALSGSDPDAVVIATAVTMVGVADDEKATAPLDDPSVDTACASPSPTPASGGATPTSAPEVTWSTWLFEIIVPENSTMCAGWKSAEVAP